MSFITTLIPSIKYYHDCQIWDLQSWQCLKSFEVPAFVRFVLASISGSKDSGLALTSVSCINNNIECLVLKYFNMVRKFYKYGLLMLTNGDTKFIEDRNTVEDNYKGVENQRK